MKDHPSPHASHARRGPLKGGRSRPADDGERGSAVVEFVLISLLILTLLLAVLQVAVYVHVRNVVTASAQEGARFAANADVDSSLGAARKYDAALTRRCFGAIAGRLALDPDADGPAFAARHPDLLAGIR